MKGAAGLVAIGIGGLALLFGLPLVVETFTLVDVTVFVILSILALSLALVWGFGGILCFGQSAFFGLGGYAYALAVLNMGDSTVPILLGILLPMLFAALLGYFMFWGRVSDIYLAVITLTVSLILFHLINSTSGPEYRLGAAPLGGANGIPGVPPINVPGDPGRQLGFDDMFQLAMAVLLLVYFGLRALLASHFGRVVVSIRENELRAELLGYDARRYKLGGLRHRCRHRRAWPASCSPIGARSSDPTFSASSSPPRSSSGSWSAGSARWAVPSSARSSSST